MTVYFGADHRGFVLKEKLKAVARGLGHEIQDKGALEVKENDDFPDYAVPVAKEVVGAPNTSRGILLCGSGVGMDVVANRFKGIRCVLAASAEQVLAARHDDDVNVLAIAANHVDENAAAAMVRTFLSAEYMENENHRRRLEKINDLGGTV